MIGVELDEPRGNCDGSLAGHGRYFVSEPRRGLMVRAAFYFLFVCFWRGGGLILALQGMLPGKILHCSYLNYSSPKGLTS